MMLIIHSTKNELFLLMEESLNLTNLFIFMSIHFIMINLKYLIEPYISQLAL